MDIYRLDLIMPGVGMSSAKQCCECLHWWPYPLRQGIGTCQNSKSLNYDRANIATGEACKDFVVKALGRNGLTDVDFYWCETCREYLYRDRFFLHSSHKIHTGVAMTDVEFNVESTFAGD